MESLTTTIRFVTLNCRTLSSELQQAALSRLLRYLCVPFAALQETRMRDRLVMSIENYTIYCGDADENKVGGCAIAVRNDYKNLVEEFGSTSSKCAFLRLRDRRGSKLWIVSAHAPTETAEDNSKDAFYDELNALMSKIPSQQVVIVGIDANAKMGLEQQSDVLGKWYYAAERTSDNGDRLVDLCEQTGLVIAMLEYGPGRSLAMQIPSQSASRTLQGKRSRAGDFNQEKRLRRKLRRQLQQDRDNEWTSRAMEFEKAWEDRNPRKAYTLLKQYSGKMRRCSPVLNTASGVAVGEATLPFWREHFKTLLNPLAPSAPELEHVHRLTYAVNDHRPSRRF
ncbi:hypothetical protein RB195_021999 [Necator americanus]|uniref:Endonuclease/exonuclease/phosphatase domain-containing protein n=2 Tax=Necator americanus TaxID=51031 RepID=A0ABR1EDM4_NECAM